MIDATRLAFEPLIAWWAIAAIGSLATLCWGAYLILRGRAWLTRGMVIGLLALTLSNPAIIQEEREPLPSVAAIVLDQSESMSFGERQVHAEAALAAITSALQADPSLELRIARSDPGAPETQMLGALESLMADVPRDRIAGAILLTDGQVHDAEARANAISGLGPVHSLIVGDRNADDRRITIVDGPRFGIVGEQARFIIRVDDPREALIPVTLSVNGGPLRTLTVTPGEDTPVSVEIDRRGDNTILLEAPPGTAELTLANNRALATLSGVRDRLRVLLISGRPNASGRVWRDLLKSDPQVDLVHFTILRPTYKPRLERIDELALIPFPHEELFQEKLHEFDLVIFDQYERSGIITMSYLSNMAQYVDDGGALLIAAGEPFAGPGSLAETPLAAVLPASPTGRIEAGHYTPSLTEDGRRHSVTAPMEGRDWGGWLRYIEAEADVGDVLMTGPDDRPLLVVDRVGEGRVGQLMSDQIWLWARGHEGGGPFSELIRRLVHWMMKEPELEERRLDLQILGDEARVELRSLAGEPAPLSLETADGQILSPEWRDAGPGRFVAQSPVDGLGLFRAQAGGLEAIALKGPRNPAEYADLRSVTDRLEPVAAQTGGAVRRVSGTESSLPDIRRVSRRGRAEGAGWIGLRERDAYAVRDSQSQPLLPGWLVVLLSLGLLLLAWHREGR